MSKFRSNYFHARVPFILFELLQVASTVGQGTMTGPENNDDFSTLKSIKKIIESWILSLESQEWGGGSLFTGKGCEKYSEHILSS